MKPLVGYIVRTVNSNAVISLIITDENTKEFVLKNQILCEAYQQENEDEAGFSTRLDKIAEVWRGPQK